MPIWGGHEWDSAGDKGNCCCNLFPNHKVFSGIGEDNILVIRWSLDSFQGVNSCCNTYISDRSYNSYRAHKDNFGVNNE